MARSWESRQATAAHLSSSSESSRPRCADWDVCRIFDVKLLLRLDDFEGWCLMLSMMTCSYIVSSLFFTSTIGLLELANWRGVLDCMRLGRRLCNVYWKIWLRISLEWIVHFLWWSNLPSSAGALKGEQVGLEMRYFLYQMTLLGAFHWKPKNFAFFEYKGGIAGPHCCVHAHHVLWPSVSFHQMISFWDFQTKHSSCESY